MHTCISLFCQLRRPNRNDIPVITIMASTQFFNPFSNKRSHIFIVLRGAIKLLKYLPIVFNPFKKWLVIGLCMKYAK